MELLATGQCTHKNTSMKPARVYSDASRLGLFFLLSIDCPAAKAGSHARLWAASAAMGPTPGRRRLAALALALGAFIRARTTVNPLAPEEAATLVTTGLYRISRNPMYLAMAAILTGGAFLMGNLSAFVAPILFVWLMTEFQIKPEERALQARFGEAFDAYRIRTRRWI